MQASAASDVEASARDACKLFRGKKTNIPYESWTALVTACTPALSSPAVAEDFLSAVAFMCMYHGRNSRSCASEPTGVLALMIDMMIDHATTVQDVAVRGCEALGWLAFCNPASEVDAVLMPAGVLDVITHAMAAHPGNHDVQLQASRAVSCMSERAKPTGLELMRKGPVIELLKTASRNHGQEVGYDTVQRYCQVALFRLAPSPFVLE